MLICKDRGFGNVLSELGAKLRRKASEVLVSGLCPRKMALMVALGVTLGIIPLLWGATFLCAGAAFMFRLNQAGIQIVNYLVYPLQLLLIVPYYRLGGVLFSKHADPSLHSPPSSTLLADAGAATIKAIAAWGLTAPAVILVVYGVSLPLLRSALQKRGIGEEQMCRDSGCGTSTL